MDFHSVNGIARRMTPSICCFCQYQSVSFQAIERKPPKIVKIAGNGLNEDQLEGKSGMVAKLSLKGMGRKGTTRSGA